MNGTMYGMFIRFLLVFSCVFAFVKADFKERLETKEGQLILTLEGTPYEIYQFHFKSWYLGNSKAFAIRRS
jgi:hypothetical protein